jgi:6-phosphofructokinase 1
LLVIVAEGAVTNKGEPIHADAVRAAIEATVHIESRTTVLGHIQRGGHASFYDRCMVRQ